MATYSTSCSQPFKVMVMRKLLEVFCLQQRIEEVDADRAGEHEADPVQEAHFFSPSFAQSCNRPKVASASTTNRPRAIASIWNLLSGGVSERGSRPAAQTVQWWAHLACSLVFCGFQAKITPR